MQCNTMQSNRRQYNTCNTKKYHVIPYLSRLKPQLGRWGLFSQAGWFHMGCNSAGWAGCSVVMLWTPHKAIFRTQKISHKISLVFQWIFCLMNILLNEYFKFNYWLNTFGSDSTFEWIIKTYRTWLGEGGVWGRFFISDKILCQYFRLNFEMSIGLNHFWDRFTVWMNL